MSSTQALAGGMPVPVNRRRPPWRGRRRGSDFRWAVAFVLPYAAVFLAFVVYPASASRHGLSTGTRALLKSLVSRETTFRL
jgi:hypothetical protein